MHRRAGVGGLSGRNGRRLARRSQRQARKQAGGEGHERSPAQGTAGKHGVGWRLARGRRQRGEACLAPSLRQPPRLRATAERSRARRCPGPAATGRRQLIAAIKVPDATALRLHVRLPAPAQASMRCVGAQNAATGMSNGQALAQGWPEQLRQALAFTSSFAYSSRAKRGSA